MCSRPFFSWFVEAWWALGAAERAQLAVTLEGLEFTLPLIRHAVAVAWAFRCCPPGPFADRTGVGRRNPAGFPGTCPGKDISHVTSMSLCVSRNG